MFGHTFYNDSLKKYVSIFGTLFNDIKIDRVSANNVITTFKVPLAFGQRDKLLARVTDDPNLDRPDSITLPRIGFEVKNISYDGQRKELTLGRIFQATANTNAYSSVYRPVPYNIEFELSIYAKTLEDGNRIYEQILPFFTPSWAVTANVLKDFPDYKRDINIILNGSSMNPEIYGAFKERGILTWKLDFTMQAWFFGPASRKGLIKIAETNFITDWDAGTPLETITIQPGVDANGNPTTILANSIDVDLITEEMDFGYIITISTGD